MLSFLRDELRPSSRSPLTRSFRAVDQLRVLAAEVDGAEHPSTESMALVDALQACMQTTVAGRRRVLLVEDSPSVRLVASDAPALHG